MPNVKALAGQRILTPAGVASLAPLQNLCMNPNMLPLPGTHTTLIQDLTGTGAQKNSLIPGWTFNTTSGGTPDIKCDVATFTSQPQARNAIELTLNTGAGSGTGNFIEQEWSSANENQFLVDYARGKFLTFSVDINPSVSGVSILLQIVGAVSGTFVTAIAFTGTTGFDRKSLFTTARISNSETSLKFSIIMTSFTNAHRFHAIKPMIVATEEPLIEAPYVPRANQRISSAQDIASGFNYTTPADTLDHVTGDGTADTDFNVNNNRPSWANRARIALQGQVGAAGSTFLLKPNGDTNFFGITDGVTNDFAQPTIPFGIDGQLEFAVSNTAVHGFFNVKDWIGEGV